MLELHHTKGLRLGQHRSTNRYVPTPEDFEEKLVARMILLAEEHPKWGYRLVHGLLVDEGWPVNKKRIERLWRQEGLQLPPYGAKPHGQKAIGEDANSIWRLPPRYRNHIWTYDFIKRRTSDGRPIRVLNVMDEYTRVALGSHVARSIGAKAVEEHLDMLFARHGRPTLIRADNGREFIAGTLLDWLAERQVRGVFIAKAKPQQNGYGERFNGTMERELFGHEVYHTVQLRRGETRRSSRDTSERCGSARRPHKEFTPRRSSSRHAAPSDPEHGPRPVCNTDPRLLRP